MKGIQFSRESFRRPAVSLGAAALVMLMGTAAVLATSPQEQAAPEKWLHVSVVSKEAAGETVRVNLPLSFAEKVLAAINKDKLQEGKIRIKEMVVNGVDIRAVLEALKTTRDGEFVTVEGRDKNVRVSKSGGYIIVKAHETRPATEKKEAHTEKVDVKVPMSVVEALLSGAKDELDLVAGIRALAAHGDSILVTVEDGRNTVKVWVDSRNTSSGT
jgi:hypothetical protein